MPLSGSAFDGPLSRAAFDPLGYGGSLPSSQLFNRREPTLDSRLDALRDRHEFERNELLLSSGRQFDTARPSRYDDIGLQDEPRYDRFEPVRQPRLDDVQPRGEGGYGRFVAAREDLNDRRFSDRADHGKSTCWLSISFLTLPTGRPLHYDAPIPQAASSLQYPRSLAVDSLDRLIPQYRDVPLGLSYEQAPLSRPPTQAREAFDVPSSRFDY